MHHEKENYTVFKKHYLIPMVTCIFIILAGIVMTVLDHSAYGIDDDRRHITITGPQTIGLGTGLLVLVLLYTRWLYKDHKKNH
jgi:Trk-type K+ transport system membrane component